MDNQPNLQEVTVSELLSYLQLQVESGSMWSGAPLPLVLASFDHIMSEVAAVAAGDTTLRSKVEAELDEIEEQGWHIREAVQRIWAGERRFAVLTAGLDDLDAELVGMVLRIIYPTIQVIVNMTPEQFVASLPNALQDAWEQRDMTCFWQLFNALPFQEQQAIKAALEGVFNYLQIQQLDEEMEGMTMEQALADLPDTIHEVLARGDKDLLDYALHSLLGSARSGWGWVHKDLLDLYSLPPHKLHAAMVALRYLQTQAQERLQARALQEQEEHIRDLVDTFFRNFEPFLQQIAVVATGDEIHQHKIEEQLAELEKQGFHIKEAVHRIWAGERNATKLTSGLNPIDRALVLRLLEIMALSTKRSAVLELLTEFAIADWERRRQMLTENADLLLNEAVEQIFDKLLEVVDTETNKDFIHANEELRILLRRCRMWGIDAVWYLERYMRLGAEIDIPTEYEPDVMQIAALLSHRKEDLTVLVQAVTAMQALLFSLPSSIPGLFRAALLCDLADAMRTLPANHVVRKLDEIEKYYREALPYYQEANQSIILAFIQRSLGNVLSEQGRYVDALEPYKMAIKGLREDKDHEVDREVIGRVLYEFADALIHLGRIKEALEVDAESAALLPGVPSDFQRLPLLYDFIEAGQTKRYQLLSEHSDWLLSEFVESMLEQSIEAAKTSANAAAIQDFETIHRLLRRCRTWGIEPVGHLELHMQLGRRDVAIHAEDEASIMQIATLLSQQKENNTALEKAIELMQAILGFLPPHTSSLFRAALLTDLADAMQALPAKHAMRKLEQIETYYRSAAQSYQAADRPKIAAILYLNLADLLLANKEWKPARDYYEQALPSFVAKHDLLGQANTLIDLGRTKFELGEHEQGMQDVKQAAEIFRTIQNEVWVHQAEKYLIEMLVRMEHGETGTQAIQLMQDFAVADWNRRRNLLKEFEDLFFSEIVESIFDKYLEINSDIQAVHELECLRMLLRRCRTWGIDPVWYFESSMHLGHDIDIPPEHESNIMQIATLLSQQSEGNIVLEQAIEIMQRLLDHLTANLPPLFEAALLCDLAKTMMSLPHDHPTRKLDIIENSYREALLHYQEVKKPLDVANILRSLGHLLCEQGRYGDALEPLRAAIQYLRTSERNKDAAAGLLSIYADALEKLGRIDDALMAHNEALSLLPSSPPLLRNRAVTLIAMRRLAEAELDLARAIEFDGNENSPYLWRHRAHLAIARGSGLLADQMLDEAIKRDASLDDDTKFLRAQSAWLRGDLIVALETLQYALGKANRGDQFAMSRDMQLLLDEHPDLPGKEEIQELLI